MCLSGRTYFISSLAASPQAGAVDALASLILMSIDIMFASSKVSCHLSPLMVVNYLMHKVNLPILEVLLCFSALKVGQLNLNIIDAKWP